MVIRVRFKPFGFSACTIGPVVIIYEPKSKIKSLIVHEQVHVKQWKCTWGLFWFLYLFSKSHRLKYEAEAYAEQARQYKWPYRAAKRYAKILANKYFLNVTKQQAFDAIKQKLDMICGY